MSSVKDPKSKSPPSPPASEVRASAAELKKRGFWPVTEPQLDMVTPRLVEGRQFAPWPVQAEFQFDMDEEELIAAVEEMRGNHNGVLPDEERLADCYRKLMSLKGMYNGYPYAVKEGIDEVLSEIARTEQGRYIIMVDSLLMLHWTRRKEGNGPIYDDFMKSHVEAIDHLVRGWAKGRQFMGRRPIKVLDVSCGTGRVLEATIRAIPEKFYRRLHIVANDVSAAALEVARETLSRFSKRMRIEFTQYDISRRLPDGMFDIVMLSQTLPFICDERALREQRLGIGLPSDERRHIGAKQSLIEALMKKVKVKRGHLLLIDEDPMKLSMTPHDFDSLLETCLFREIFRSVQKDGLIDIMKRVQDARFASHSETFIDRKHGMYLMDYTRHGNCKQEPQGDDFKDVQRIINAMGRIHPILIERFQRFDENRGTVYRPVDGKSLYIDSKHYEGRIEGKPVYWHKNGSYDIIVISGLMHTLGADEYRRLVEKIKSSAKAVPGTALLFIDKWPAPGTPNAVSNSKARSVVMEGFADHEFIASVRLNDKYGYLYVVRDISRRSIPSPEQPTSED